MRARFQAFLLSLREIRTRMLLVVGALVFWMVAVYWTCHTDITIQMAQRFTTDQSAWRWHVIGDVSFEDRDFNRLLRRVFEQLQPVEPRAKSEPEVYSF